MDGLTGVHEHVSRRGGLEADSRRGKIAAPTHRARTRCYLICFSATETKCWLSEAGRHDRLAILSMFISTSVNDRMIGPTKMPMMPNAFAPPRRAKKTSRNRLANSHEKMISLLHAKRKDVRQSATYAFSWKAAFACSD